MTYRDSIREGDNVENDDTSTIFNLSKRRIDLFGKVDRQMILDLTSILDELGNSPMKQDEQLTIVVNTTGGLALQGLAAHDILTHSGFNIRTIVLGEAASSGLALVLAGQERLIYPNAILHFHATAIEFDKPKNVIEQSDKIIQGKLIKTIDALYQKIFLDNSNLTKRRLRSLELNEACLNAKQALEAGLVHRIIENRFNL